MGKRKSSFIFDSQGLRVDTFPQNQFIILHTRYYVLYYVVLKISEYMFISLNVQKYSLNQHWFK